MLILNYFLYVHLTKFKKHFFMPLGSVKSVEWIMGHNEVHPTAFRINHHTIFNKNSLSSWEMKHGDGHTYYPL